MIRRRRLLAVSVSAVVALCGLLPGVANAEPPALEIVGVVLDATGAPVPDAWVGVYLWPSVVPTAVGATIEEPLLAETISGVDGAYVLTVPSTPLVTDAAALGSGYINMELRATGAGFTFTTRSSRMLSGADVEGVDAASTTISLSSRTIEATRIAGEAAGRRGPLICTPWTVNADLGFKKTTVGELHSWKSISSFFSYGSNADSTIDIAFKNAASPGWALNGSVHIGNTTGQGMAGTTISATSSMPSTGYAAAGVFHYQELTQSFSGAGTRYQRAADRWNGADIFLDAGMPIAGFDGKCRTTYAQYAHRFSPGQASWTRTTSDAFHFGAAVDLGVLQAGASSGFSTSASVTFTHPYTGSGWSLCGNDGDYLHAHRIFAGR